MSIPSIIVFCVVLDVDGDDGEEGRDGEEEEMASRRGGEWQGDGLGGKDLVGCRRRGSGHRGVGLSASCGGT